MTGKELIKYLAEKSLVSSAQAKYTPLSGGVSCQILLIDDGDNRFVLKRALEKLKVKDDWFADVKRNHIEQRYLKYVAQFLPEAVPAITYSDTDHHFFCMEMLENGLQNWKELMLAGDYTLDYAKTAASVLGTIHNRSVGDNNVAKDFDTLANFEELRIEPYLLKTAERHPDLAPLFKEEAERLKWQKKCLVHGDYSPKNILVSPDRLVVLDCEVAWYGDPVFDVAFLLNHFMLKALRAPQDADQLLNLAAQAWKSYQANAAKVVDNLFEGQLVNLLQMLMLARVDGKSPVEYLNADQQQVIRDFIYQELPKGIKELDVLISDWKSLIQKNRY